MNKPGMHRATSKSNDILNLPDESLPALDRLPRRIGDIGKLLVLLAGFSYALGLVVTNSYLLRYGFTDFGIFRTRFILTGALALLIPALVTFISFYFWYGVYRVIVDIAIPRIRGERLKTFRFTRNQFFRAHFAVLVILLYLRISSILLPPMVSGNVLFLMGFGLLTLFVLGVVAGVSGFAIRQLVDRITPNLRLMSSATYQGPQLFEYVSGAFFTFATVLYFSFEIFALIPPQLGGGKADEVLLVMTDHSAGSSGNFGLVLVVEMIWWGDSMYLVRMEDGEIQAIENRLVDRVILTPASNINSQRSAPWPDTSLEED